MECRYIHDRPGHEGHLAMIIHKYFERPVRRSIAQGVLAFAHKRGSGECTCADVQEAALGVDTNGTLHGFIARLADEIRGTPFRDPAMQLFRSAWSSRFIPSILVHTMQAAKIGLLTGSFTTHVSAAAALQVASGAASNAAASASKPAPLLFADTNLLEAPMRLAELLETAEDGRAAARLEDEVGVVGDSPPTAWPRQECALEALLERLGDEVPAMAGSAATSAAFRRAPAGP